LSLTAFEFILHSIILIVDAFFLSCVLTRIARLVFHSYLVQLLAYNH
jgi:hypothetical protein